jgi:hypothetical protein
MAALVERVGSTLRESSPDHRPEALRSRRAALEVLLLLADADARWGYYASAVDLLNCAARPWGRFPPTTS